MTSKHDLIELLYEAQSAELGIAINTLEPKRLRARLYPIMKEENITNLQLSAMEDELWIVKRSK